MPQGSTTPNWYNDDTYIKDKVAECNTIKFGQQADQPWVDWTEQAVRDFLAAANGEDSYAPWMGYDNFVSNGNAENCSPNPLFNVMEYLTAKANQLNGLNDGAGYDGSNEWTAETVLKYFNDHHISAWDHFTTAGQFENVNPSNAMDLSDFLANKAKQCNDIEFDGKDDWDSDAVLAYYQEHGINAVQVAVNVNDPNVVPVPRTEQVTAPTDVNPWGNTPQPTYNDITLEAGQHQYPGTDGNDNFIATVTSSPSKSTLQRDDQIDGGEGNDMLTVAMTGNFGGFTNEGYLKNVETVNLTNEGTTDLTFNANGATGVETFNVNGNVNLQNVLAGVSVNLADVNDDLDIEYADGQVDGTSDSLALGVKDVIGPAPDSEAVAVTAAGIETMSVTATGTASKIDLSDNDDLTALNVAGAGDLAVVAVDEALSTVDADKADGDVDIDATAASLIKSVTLGAGNDKFTVSNLAQNAPVAGGEGNDTLTFTGITATTTYSGTMDSVERLGVTGNTAEMVFAGENYTGLDTLLVRNIAADVRLTQYADNSELNVVATGVIGSPSATSAAPAVKIDTVTDVNLTIGDSNPETTDQFYGSVVLADATSLSATVVTGSATGPSAFDGAIKAVNLNDLSITTGNNSSTFTLDEGDLANVSNITVAGYDSVTLNGLSTAANIGTAVTRLNVDATGFRNGTFTATFGDNEAENSKGIAQDATINIQGSQVTTNNLTVDGTFENYNLTTGTADDEITISGDIPAYAGSGRHNFNINMGQDNDAGDTLNIAAGVNVDLTGWNGKIQGVEQITIGTGATLNLGDVQVVGDVKFDNQGTLEMNVGPNQAVALGEGKDVIVLGAGIENGRALNVTINNFDISNDKIDLAGFMDGFEYGANAAKAEYGAGTIYASVSDSAYKITAASGAAHMDSVIGQTNDINSGKITVSLNVDFSAGEDDKIYKLADTVDGNDANAIAAVFASGTAVEASDDSGAQNTISADFASSSVAALNLESGDNVVVAAKAGDDVKLWYVSNDDGGGINPQTEVMLIGTLTNVSLDDLSQANFVTA